MSNPWLIDEGDFYEIESQHEQMEFLLRYAILAPSGHNTQPWSFQIVNDGVAVYADTSRRLLIVDHEDRELLLSIGAAITNFRVAAAHFGFDTVVRYEGRSIETLPVATITVRETSAPDFKLAALFPAIRRRHTNRAPYDEQPLAPPLARVLCDVIDTYPESLRVILPRYRDRVIECIESAEKTLMARPAYRAELAEWVRTDMSRDDGLSATTIGIPTALASLAPWLVRNFDAGTLKARQSSELVRSASMLLVLTSDDHQVSLLEAGQTLEMLLLTITQCGLQYSILSAPTEVDETRDRLRLLIGGTRPPQLLIRVGSATVSARPTRRRAVERVIA